jgi:hypothetical protein
MVNMRAARNASVMPAYLLYRAMHKKRGGQAASVQN